MTGFANRFRLPLALSAVCVVFCWSNALYGVQLGSQQTWSSAPSVEGWQNTTGYGALSNPGGGGAGPGLGYLRITFGAQGGTPVPQDDTIFASGPDYNGSYQIDNLTLTLSFYVQDVPALSTILYLHSLVSGNTWEYAFSQSSLGVWADHTIPFAYGAGWTGPGNATDYWNDLANVEWVGVNVGRSLDTMQQVYGVDNWQCQVPEPGTLGLMISGLIPLAAGFRARSKRGTLAVTRED